MARLSAVTMSEALAVAFPAVYSRGCCVCSALAFNRIRSRTTLCCARHCRGIAGAGQSASAEGGDQGSKPKQSGPVARLVVRSAKHKDVKVELPMVRIACGMAFGLFAAAFL